MSSKLPMLGSRPKSTLPSVLKVALFIGVLSGGAYYVWQKRVAAQAAAIAAAANPNAQPAAVPPPLPVPGAAQPASAPPATAAAPGPSAPAGAPAAAPSNAPVAAAPAVPAAAPGGLQHVHVTITGPLEQAIVAALGKEVGPALTQVVTRTLVWWIEIPSDIKKNDSLDVIYEQRPNQEPEVHAVSFVSGKTGQTHRVYLYHAPSEPYSRYYDPDGNELELRLKDGPLENYERVTSLLRDGRRHKGVDFRTPVGTPVKAPFAGTVTRRNWNFRGNGNSLEISASDGSKKAMFLHLDVLPKSIKVGDKITAGQQIAQSGNSGHSFAPHLHYQLIKGEDRVLDPFTVHATYRRSLPEKEKAGLKEAVQKLDALMGISAVATTGNR